MNCLVPDGGSFIRANEAGTLRSFTNREFIDFLEALQEMGWSWRNKAQGGVIRPANGERRLRSRHGSAGSKELSALFLYPPLGKTYHGGAETRRRANLGRLPKPPPATLSHVRQ
jgi:hypothetical protein